MYKNNLLFDHRQIELFRERAVKNKNIANDFLLSYLAKDLAYRLKDINRTFKNALDLHSYNNLVAQALHNHHIKDVIRVETSKNFLQNFDKIIVSPREHIDNLPSNVDLITSFLSMQLINNMPLYLQKIKNKLKPDGLFIGAFLGNNSLFELRDSFIEAELLESSGASPRVAPFIDLRILGDLLHNSGFNFPVVDSEILIVEYSSFDNLLKDLRSWGMQNALFNRSKTPITRKTLNIVKEIYTKKYAIGQNKIKVTFNFLWFSAWAPCETHTKPIAKGSAKVSLRDIL